MSPVGWNVLIFAGKWVFIGLIYLALFVVLIDVRREMSLRVRAGQRPGGVAAGRLKVIRPGSDPQVQIGGLLYLRPEMALGAAPDNDLILKDEFISGHHARLRWDGVAWWVEDLGSRNGTFVNAIQCPPHQPQRIPEGATLQVGGMAFELLE